jgi:tetratricopeptide (TPR) repeat protein
VADAEVVLAEKKAAQAFEAYQAKRFAEAVGLYLEAHRAAPNADVLYNVARIYDAKLGDRPLAISFYRRE